jgi:hypothetical protein
VKGTTLTCPRNAPSRIPLVCVMTQHREVPVKVNAWADEGIAELVSVLSELDGLTTLESCQ